MDALNPEGAWERHLREQEEVFRSCPFRFYGLDISWKGPRMIGGHSSDDEKITSVELTHGDMSTIGPWARVETAPTSEERANDLQRAAMELWHESQRPPADLPSHLKGAWMHRRFAESFTREAHWIKVPISVDQVRVDFDWLEEGNDWVAQAAIRDLRVTIRGHGLPVESVGLATVHDIEPYVEGHRRFLEEQRQLYERSAGE